MSQADGFYRSVLHPGMEFRRRLIDGCLPPEPDDRVRYIERRLRIWAGSDRILAVHISADAARYIRQRAGWEGHPARGDTWYSRDDCGRLIVDELDETGFRTVPRPAEKAIVWSTTTEQRQAARERARVKAIEEDKAIAKMRRKFEKRQSIGDPNCKPSENEDFPLLAVLRRDQRHDLIVAALNYRQLVALCESEPLKGMDYSSTDGLEVVRRHVLHDGVKEVEAAAKDGFIGDRVAGGQIIYRTEVKRSKGAYALPARNKKPAEAASDRDPIVGRTRSLHVKLNGNNLADYLDKRPLLAKVRAALGGLQDPIEDAVLGARTLQRIGEDDGFKGPSAASAGKALVYRGLAILDSFLGEKKRTAANDNYLIEKRKIA